MDVDGWKEKYVETYLETYPLVNCPITMENHHFVMGKSTISMAIFNSYVSLPEGISLCHLLETKCSPQTDQPVSAAEVLLVEGRDDAAAKGRTSNDF